MKESSNGVCLLAECLSSRNLKRVIVSLDSNRELHRILTGLLTSYITYEGTSKESIWFTSIQMMDATTDRGSIFCE